MKYISLVSIVFSGFLISGIADASISTPILLAQANIITAADLGVENPGLLPTNPFYFLKEWGRAILRVTTLDSVAKVSLELKIVNEKAAEVSQVEKLSGENPDAVAGALSNYRDAQIRLKEKFDTFAQTSQNPNVDALISDFIGKSIKHELLFDSLAQKFGDNMQLLNLIESAKGTMEQSLVSAAQKNASEKFASELEKSLQDNIKGDLKNYYAVVIINRIKEKSPVDSQNSLQDISTKFTVKAQQDVQDLLKENNIKELESLVQELPESPQKQDLGVKIFNKQKEELTAPKVIPAALPITLKAKLNAEIVICDQVKQNLNDVWNSFKTGKITAQEYAQKNEILKTQIASCEVINDRQATTTSAEVGGNTVCTSQYDPICGADNKTYSNDCVAEASGITIQYGGECKSSDTLKATSATTTDGSGY